MHVKKDEVMLSVFFFKQKTSYELRISDWSSDVCSSDREGADARQQITEREDALHPLFGDAEGRADVGDFAAFLRQPGESFPAGHLVGREQIGRASCRERVVSTGRSRWSPSD